MQLDGLLSRVPLRELLDLCVASLVNGALEIDAPGGVARIFFVEGRCVHAVAPGAAGFDAIWPLFELPDARFRFVAGLTADRRSVVEPTRDLIARAASFAERWARIRPQIPRLDLVPALVVPAASDHIRIEEDDWPALSGVDGVRTIEAIARRAMLDPCEVCEALLRLRDRGLVRFHESPPAAESAIEPHESRTVAAGTARESRATAGPERSAAGSPGGAFFSRLLATLPATTPDANATADDSPRPDSLDADDIVRLLRA
jgi:hypothetical protein